MPRPLHIPPIILIPLRPLLHNLFLPAPQLIIPLLIPILLLQAPINVVPTGHRHSPIIELLHIDTRTFAQPIRIVRRRCIAHRKGGSHVSRAEPIREILQVAGGEAHAIFEDEVVGGFCGAGERIVRLQEEVEVDGVRDAGFYNRAGGPAGCCVGTFGVDARVVALDDDYGRDVRDDGVLLAVLEITVRVADGFDFELADFGALGFADAVAVVEDLAWEVVRALLVAAPGFRALLVAAPGFQALYDHGCHVLLGDDLTETCQ
jgi:hypothetical protein